jgi:hypothetical protein
MQSSHSCLKRDFQMHRIKLYHIEIFRLIEKSKLYSQRIQCGLKEIRVIIQFKQILVKIISKNITVKKYITIILSVVLYD